MFELIETRWVIGIIAVIVFFIVMDELAYNIWKKANPGSLYSHLYDKTLTPLDPSRPPSTIYYEP